MKKIFAPFQMPSIKKCVAVGCNTDQNSKIILFSIPRPIPESWQKFLSVSDYNSKTKICEKHFKKCDVICDKNCLHKKIFPWPENIISKLFNTVIKKLGHSVFVDFEKHVW